MVDNKKIKKRIAKGEPEALVELFDQHGERLLKYLAAKVGSTNARDVLQNVFTRLFRYHKKLAKAENLTAYIYTTARNETIRFLQRPENRRASKTQSLDAAIGVADTSAPSTSSLENKESAQILLSKLDKASKEIVELKIFSGLTFKEVAKIIGLPEQTAATKYRRAIEKLKTFSQAPPSANRRVKRKASQ